MRKAVRPTWFVTFVGAEFGAPRGYRRSSQTFSSEGDAKAFAKRMVGRCDLIAGTINPYVPKRFIGSDEGRGLACRVRRFDPVMHALSPTIAIAATFELEIVRASGLQVPK